MALNLQSATEMLLLRRDATLVKSSSLLPASKDKLRAALLAMNVLFGGRIAAVIVSDASEQSGRLSVYDILFQQPCWRLHPNPAMLHLHTLTLSSVLSKRETFLRGLPLASPNLDGDQLESKKTVFSDWCVSRLVNPECPSILYN